MNKLKEEKQVKLYMMHGCGVTIIFTKDQDVTWFIDEVIAKGGVPVARVLVAAA